MTRYPNELKKDDHKAAELYSAFTENPAYYSKRAAGFTLPFSIVWSFVIVSSWVNIKNPLYFISGLILLIFVGFSINLGIVNHQLKKKEHGIWLKPYVYMETTLNYLALVFVRFLTQVQDIRLLWSPLLAGPCMVIILLLVLMLIWFIKRPMAEKPKAALTQFIFIYFFGLIGLFVLLSLTKIYASRFTMVVLILYLVLMSIGSVRYYKKRLPKNMAGTEF